MDPMDSLNSNSVNPMAHQASSPWISNGPSSNLYPYQPPQIRQNAGLNEHVQIPGLSNLDGSRRSLSPLTDQALPSRNSFYGSMSNMPLPSTRSITPSLDPRLKKVPAERSLQDRIADFENDIQMTSASGTTSANLAVFRRSYESPTAERRHTFHGDARPSNVMTTNDDKHPHSLAGKKRSRSSEKQYGSDDSADGTERFIERRQAPGHETRRRRRRRRLSRDSHKPTRVQSHQCDSEDGDSLFVPAQPRNLKAESVTSGSPEADAAPTGSIKTSSARELKQRLAGKSAKAFSRKMNPEKDPENIAIKRMRCEERKQFDDIADMLNKARVAGGLEPTFTANAVYGRFQRIAPRIAVLEGQPDFNYRDYLHIPREARAVPEPAVSLPAMSARQETLLVEAYEQVKKEVWVHTARKFREMGGLELSPEQAALKFKSI